MFVSGFIKFFEIKVDCPIKNMPEIVNRGKKFLIDVIFGFHLLHLNSKCFQNLKFCDMQIFIKKVTNDKYPNFQYSTVILLKPGVYTFPKYYGGGLYDIMLKTGPEQMYHFTSNVKWHYI